MTTDTFIRCLDPTGVRLGTVAQYTDLQYVLTCAPGAIGVLELTVPSTVPLWLFPKDGRLLPYRAIDGRAPAHDNGKVYLIRKRESTADTTTITAYDATSILMRRIIAYYAGSTYADKAAAAADDQIKQFARDNLTAPDSSRKADTTALNVSAYLSIQANLGAGASIAKACAWRNLHEVATELAQASTSAGTYCTFEIVAPTESTLELRTVAGQRGVDRRASSGQPIVFAPESGSLENARLVEDWSEQVTYAYVGGAGEGQWRQINYTYYTAQVSDVPFGRIESFTDHTNTADLTTLIALSEAEVFAHRGKITLAGDLIDTPRATRGLHYDLGDLVTVALRGLSYDMRLDTIHVQADAPALIASEATGGVGRDARAGRQRAILRTDIV